MQKSAFSLTLVALMLASTGRAAVDRIASDDWIQGRTVDGVVVEYRATSSGFHDHRGEALMCAGLSRLEEFVADTRRFPEWIPYTESALLLESSEQTFTYYVRSSTPWPIQDRDMVYEISRHHEADGSVRLDVVGLPDKYPEQENATRIREASGQWRLLEEGGVTRVRYELYVHPGRVPAFAANRRLATVVGKTLANLAAHFPCAPD